MTGMVHDISSAVGMYNAVKAVDWINLLPMAGGVAALVAIFGDIFKVSVSFGREITVISQEGVTSVPNIIGNEDLKEGFFGIYSGADAIVQAKVNVRKIE